MKYSFSLFKSVLLFIFVPYAAEGAGISDLRLCADPDCRNPVSTGVATLRYQSIDPLVLSFNQGDEVTILSKEAGQNKELWGAEVRGKRGYIPKRLVKEMRIYVRNPSFTVPTEAMQQQPPPMNPQAQQPPPQQQQMNHMPPQQQQPPPLNHQQQPPPMQQQGNFQPPQQQPWPAQPPPPPQQQQPPPVPPPKPVEIKDTPQPVEMKAQPQPVEMKAQPQPVEMKATPQPMEMKATPMPEPILKQEEAPIIPPPEIPLEQKKPEVVLDEEEEDDDDEDEDDEDDTGANKKTEEDTMDEAPKVEPIIEAVELPQVPIVEQVLVTDPPPVEPLKDDEKIEEEPLKLPPPIEEEKEEVVMPNILLGEENKMKLNETNEEKIEIQPTEDFAIPEQKEEEEGKSQPAEVEVAADAAEPLKESLTKEEEMPSIIDSGSTSNPEEKIQSSVIEEGSNFNAESVTEVDGSGGGFITTALNWLGLNEKDESLLEASGEESDSKTLQEQIASMDPSSIPADTIPTEVPTLTSSPLEVPEGFCDKDDCGKITPPPTVNEVPKEESIIPPQDIPEVATESYQDHHHHDHDHHGHGHSHNHDHGSPQEIPQVALESNHDHHGHGHGHGHSHDHDHAAPQEVQVPQEPTHDHHHHDHGHGHGHGHSHDHDGGFGHGHSHIPGYIPGFGHHYKPPVAQQPPPPPPVEQSVEQPTGQQVVEPLPVQDQQPFYPPPLELEEPPKLPPPPMQIPPESEPQMNVPEYIPVEEIFRTAEEAERKRRLEEEQQQQHQLGDDSEGVLSQVTSMLLGYAPILQDLLQFNKFDGEGGSSSSGLYPTVMTGAIVLFLTLHYLVNNKSSERSLKARISQLDSLLYESQTAKEECGSIQTKLTEYETNAAELRSQKEAVEVERIALSRRLKELEREKEALEKDLESATESATEATRLFEELLASQTDSDSWQDSMLALQAQLNNQQQAVETLKASLSQKTAECDALTTEADELRIESERYKVRVKTLQSDFETLKTSNRNLQQKSAQEGTELVKLKQEKESWVGERRNLTNQANRSAKEAEEMRSKVDQLSKSLKAKEADLAKSIHLLKQSSSGGGSGDMMMDGQLSSLIQLEAELAEAKMTIERLNEEMKSKAEEEEKFSAERMALQEQLDQWKTTVQTATKDKLEAETRLKVLSTYFTEKETQLHKELGTHEAKRAMTEENVTESVRKILETEENMALYKSQVETLTKEIEEQERSYKTRLAAQEKRAHENWVAARQLERRLEESKQEAAQLRARLTQAEKERKAEAGVKENGNVLANGGGPEGLGDLIKPVAKRVEDLTLMDPSLLSPPIPPPPPMPMPPLGLDMGMMPFHDAMFPPPHFIPPPPEMHLLPQIPLPMDHHPHRPPPLGMIAPGGGAGPGYDVDFQRDRDPPRHRYRDGGRYGPQLSPGSERSDRSDRIMDRYDDRDYRPVSPYGRHGSGRPRSVGRSRDASPERPRSFSPLPSPLYPPQVHSPEDWDDGRGYNNNNNRPPMNPRNLRQPQLGPKTSSPLIHPVETNHRQH